MTISLNTTVAGGSGGPIINYTAAQLSAMAAAGTLTPYATYVASDTGVEWKATSASVLTPVAVASKTRRIPNLFVIGDSINGNAYLNTTPTSISGDGTTLQMVFSSLQNYRAGQRIYLAWLGDMVQTFDGFYTILTASVDRKTFTVLCPYVGTSVGSLMTVNQASRTDRGAALRALFEGSNIFNIIGDSSVVGRRTDDVLRAFRTDTLGADMDFVLDCSGVNDIIQKYNGGTYATGLAWAIANKPQIVAAIKASGAVPVLTTLTPWASAYAHYVAGGMPYVVAYNEWLRSFANSNDCILVDWWKVLVDSTSANKGSALANMIGSDYLHPTPYGVSLMASELARVLTPYAPTTDILPASNAETYGYTTQSKNIWDYGPWAATVGGVVTNSTVGGVMTGTLPTGWVGTATSTGAMNITFSVVARTVAADGDSNGYNLVAVVTPAAAGDKLEISTGGFNLAGRTALGNKHRIKSAIAVSGVAGSSFQGIEISMTLRTDGVSTYAGLFPALSSPAVSPSNISGRYDVSIPPLDGSLLNTIIGYWRFYFSGAGSPVTIKLGRVGIYIDA